MSATEYRDPDGVEDQLWNVAEQTRASGRVRAKVTGIESSGSGVRVNYRLPNGDTSSESFAFPKRDHREYALVRFLSHYGLSLNAVGDLPNTLVECEVVDDEYRLAIPSRPHRDRYREWSLPFTIPQVVQLFFTISGLAIWPLGTLLWAKWEASEDGDGDVGMALIVGGVFSVCWLLIAAKVWGVL